MAVYLALYKGKGMIGNAVVRWWTRSIYSHCELVIDNMWYGCSVMDKGVRAKSIDFNAEHWDLIPLPDYLRPRIRAYFDKTHGEPYSWLDLVRSQTFNGAYDQEGASFCSDWCAAALGLPNSVTYSPKTLGDLVVWINGRWDE